MNVKRTKVTAGTVTEFEFDVYATEFAVKNFTDSDILVCLGDFDEENAVKIPAYFLEILSDNFNEKVTKYTKNIFNKVSVQAETSGEVEIRCLK